MTKNSRQMAILTESIKIYLVQKRRNRKDTTSTEWAKIGSSFNQMYISNNTCKNK